MFIIITFSFVHLLASDIVYLMLYAPNIATTQTTQTFAACCFSSIFTTVVIFYFVRRSRINLDSELGGFYTHTYSLYIVFCVRCSSRPAGKQSKSVVKDDLCVPRPRAYNWESPMVARPMSAPCRRKFARARVTHYCMLHALAARISVSS